MCEDRPHATAGSAPGQPQLEVATLGGGCFWCTEAVFQRLKGVHSVVSGFSGGQTKNPSYKDVCTGTTGHAEVSQISFDPHQVSFADLLEVFFKVHDPTTLNRQGADVGTQYRSVIFYHDDQQKQIAQQYIRQLDASGAFPGPIVTAVDPFKAFYAAEDYHQDYYNLHGRQPYCHAVIRPKVEKFSKQFHGKLKSPAEMAAEHKAAKPAE